MINQTLRVSSYFQNTELTILCYVKKAHVLFLFTLVQDTDRSLLFQADFCFYLFVLNIDMQYLMFVSFILDIQPGFFFKCKKKIHCLSFVYITKNRKLYGLRITRGLKLEFQMTIVNAILKHCKY